MPNRAILRHASRDDVSTLFEQVGGEPGLRAIIDVFVDRIFEDAMIGFFFAQVDRQRVKDKEYEFAAAHLGGQVAYTGRPLSTAHARHPIMGGHFMRRLQILKDTLREFDVPAPVREHWVKNTEAMRLQITRDAGGECNDSGRSPVEPRRLPLALSAPVGSGEPGSSPSVRRPLPIVDKRKS